MQRSKYRILGLVGQGQYGKVYCASDRRKGQLVALKELSHERSPTNQFLQELWYIISLQHPNIAACLGLEHIENGRYLVMDYCEAGTLRDLMEGDRTLGLVEGLQIMVGVLQGLDYAHKRGVIHCDIKPENILLTIQGGKWHPKLSDFGIARRLPTENHVSSPSQPPGGSPAYMAPERFYGMFSAQSDLYAMGVVLYELLVGDRPFHGLFNELMWAHMNHRVEVPTLLPDSLQQILKKALEKLPARRFDTAKSMADSLMTAMADTSVQQISDRLIPWPTTEPRDIDHAPQDQADTAISLEFYDLPYRLNSPSSCQIKPLLASNRTHLYSAIAQNLITWCYQDFHSESIPLSEPVVNLYPRSQGCYILTDHYLHWWNHSSSTTAPQYSLKLTTIFPKGHTISQPNTLAISQDGGESIVNDPQNTQIPASKYHYLTLAVPGQLRFYCLKKIELSPTSTSNYPKNYPLKLLKILSISTERLPYLHFIDGRHILATWSNPHSKSPKTIFQMYSRRGNRMGSIKLPINLNQVLPTPKPYTILALCQEQPSTLLQINLKPLNVIRVSMESPPIAFFMANWGYGWTDALGKIRIVNWSGDSVVQYGCPVAMAIAPWKQTGLAIATRAETGNSIKVVDSLTLPNQELS